MISIEHSSGNVYADLGLADVEEMRIKAQLASRIGKIVEDRRLGGQHAAEVLDLTQSQLSGRLRGRFRSIDAAKMIDCLVRLGCDVHIVVDPDRGAASTGRVEVVFRG